MDNKELLNIINQTMADTNYIKDDVSPKRYIYKIFQRWMISYMVVSGIIYIYQSVGRNLNLYEKTWYFSSVRVLYFLLFGMTLMLYFVYLFYDRKRMSIKEKDFLKFYSLIPCLLIFSKLIFPISFYINKEILLSLYNTAALDLLTLIISACMLLFYFKNVDFKIFVWINVVIYLAQLIIFGLFFSASAPSSIVIACFNIMIFLRDNGLLVIQHYLLILFLMKRVGLDVK